MKKKGSSNPKMKTRRKASPIPDKSKRDKQTHFTSKQLSEVREKLQSGKREFIEALLELRQVKNWEELGYKSLKDYLSCELPDYEYHTVVSWISSGKIEKKYFDTVGVQSLNAMRALKCDDEVQERALFESLSREYEEKFGSDKPIAPKWLTKNRVLSHKKKILADAKQILDDRCKKQAKEAKKKHQLKVRKQNEDKLEKLKDWLSNYSAEERLVDYLLKFIVNDYSSKSPEKCLKKVAKRLKKITSEIGDEGNKKEKVKA